MAVDPQGHRRRVQPEAAVAPSCRTSRQIPPAPRAAVPLRQGAAHGVPAVDDETVRQTGPVRQRRPLGGRPVEREFAVEPGSPGRAGHPVRAGDVAHVEQRVASVCAQGRVARGVVVVRRPAQEQYPAGVGADRARCVELLDFGPGPMRSVERIGRHRRAGGPRGTAPHCGPPGRGDVTGQHVRSVVGEQGRPVAGAGPALEQRRIPRHQGHRRAIRNSPREDRGKFLATRWQIEHVAQAAGQRVPGQEAPAGQHAGKIQVGILAGAQPPPAARGHQPRVVLAQPRHSFGPVFLGRNKAAA